jgi:hypothetical protein
MERPGVRTPPPQAFARDRNVALDHPWPARREGRRRNEKNDLQPDDDGSKTASR